MIHNAKSVKVTSEAYDAAIKIRDDNPEKYRGRGLVGVFDDLLLHRFTTPGKGKNSAKTVDKK